MSICELCGKQAENVLLFKTISMQTREVFQIGECSLCKARKVINPPVDLAKYYENTHMRKPNNKLYIFLKQFLLKSELNRILKFCEPGQVFLDIGCGTGDFVKTIYDQGLKVRASDSASEKPVMVKDFKDIEYYQFDYSNYSLQGLKSLDNGIVILRHVLEHATSPRTFIKKLISYGITGFYIAVPNHGNFEDKLFGQYYFPCNPPLHLWFFKKETLTNFLESEGLEIVTTGYYTIPNLVCNLYRYLYLKNFPVWLCEIFNPQGIISALSGPLDFLMPNNVLWVYARLKK